MLTDEEVKEIPNTIDRIERRYRNMNEESQSIEEGKCPNCGAETVFQGGCESCPICGWAKCG